MTDRRAPLDAALDLYGVPGPAFVARRTAAAREARRAGVPREVVAAIGRLPRPAPAAEALNRLLREDPTALAGVLDAGAALRGAHGGGSRTDVRAAVERLRAAAAQVAALAAALLEAEGRGAASVVTRLEETVRAAAVDPGASAAAVSGLLLRPLVSTGLEPVDLEGAVAVPGAPPLDGVPAFPEAGDGGRGRLRLVRGVRGDRGAAVTEAAVPTEPSAARRVGERRRARAGAGGGGDARAQERAVAQRPARRGAGEGDVDRRAARRRSAIVDLDEAGRLASVALDRGERAEAALRAASEQADATRADLERTASEVARLTERLRELRDARVAVDRAVRRARGEAETAAAAASAAVARRDDARRRLDDLGDGPS